ncbi:MAG: recombination protein RecR, partial [Gammaproteobacteria bacterium]|nr:recombination protein RecR [Gammaproteobacteria bacterium]
MPDPRSVEDLKNALKRLPGVGPKTAQRMAFHLLERDRKGAKQIEQAIGKALVQVNHCRQCNNFCETELCEICASPSRNSNSLCVVETP